MLFHATVTVRASLRNIRTLRVFLSLVPSNLEKEIYLIADYADSQKKYAVSLCFEILNQIFLDTFATQTLIFYYDKQMQNEF